MTLSTTCAEQQSSSPPRSTGKELDSRSGNETFKYRDYASSVGRWLSPDPSGLSTADLADPQSFNLYSYVGNRPLTVVDLMGLCWRGFHWACRIVKGVENVTISAKNKIRYGEWTTNTQQAEIRQIDRQNAADTNSYQRETGGSNFQRNAPNDAIGPSYWVTYWKIFSFKDLLKNDWNCYRNVAFPAIADDLNPFKPGIGTGADAAAALSRSSLEAAGAWSLERGLTVPLRSSVVRAGLSNSERFGKASGELSLLGADIALGHAVYAEYKGCQ